MQALNLPTYSFSIKSEEGRNFIFDSIRKKFIVLTPEEWVRQNIIRYLNEEKKYPLSLMSIETGFSLYQTAKRSDILIHNRQGKAIVLVECKAPKVKINRHVFDQIIRYNLTYKLDFLIATNGMKHYCAQVNHISNSWEFLKEIPDFTDIVKG